MEPSDFGTQMIIQLRQGASIKGDQALEFIRFAHFSPMRLFYQDGLMTK